MLFIADFDAAEIAGFPSHAEAACDIHFEWAHPERGWERYLALIAEYPGYPDAEPLLPPHTGPLDGWGCYPQPPAGRWRIVDGEGAVLTAFVGPYAEDAGPLAEALGEQAAYRRGRRDPACAASSGRECWTALELWLYLEEWQDARCEP